MFCPIRNDDDDNFQCQRCAMYVREEKPDGWKGCALVRMAMDIGKWQGLKLESPVFGESFEE